MPRGVIIPVISLAGVISKAGLRAGEVGLAVGLPANCFTSSSLRYSMGISLP